MLTPLSIRARGRSLFSPRARPSAVAPHHFAVGTAVLCALLAAQDVAGQAVINTFAGNGRPFRGVGGPAKDAPLGRPSHVAADGKGGVYFSDRALNVLARIDAAGTLSRVAGTGETGWSSDVGPAGAARFTWVSAIAVAPDGSVFIGDDENDRVRKITVDGLIQTIAGCSREASVYCPNWGEGGPATKARTAFVSGLALNAQGELFITDQVAAVVRKVDRHGNIHTVVGTYVEGSQGGSPFGFAGDGGPAAHAKLSSPLGLAFDAGGNLYIADSGNHRIRKVSPEGIITTVVGGGSRQAENGLLATEIQLSGPQGIAADAQGNLVVADHSHRVLKVSPSGVVTVIGGQNFGPGFAGDGGPAVDARFHTPVAVAADSSGSIFIADSGNSRVRKLDAAGIVTTVGGNGAGNFGGDGGAAPAGLLDRPQGIAFDRQGNLFIADTGNHRIRKVDAAGVITTVAGTGQPGFSGDGGQARNAQLQSPGWVAIDRGQSLLISDTANSRVRRVTSNGIISTIAGGCTFGSTADGIPAVAACLRSPQGIAVEESGSILIADNPDRVRRIDLEGVLRTAAGNGATGFSGDGGPATAASIWAPAGLAVDDKGGFYIADSQNKRVRYVDNAGIIRTVAGKGDNGIQLHPRATEAFIDYQTGIALGRDGNLYLGAMPYGVHRVTPDGHFNRIAGGTTTGRAGFSGDGGPALGAQTTVFFGGALDSSGDLYFSDCFNDRIRKISLTSVSILVPVIVSAAGAVPRAFFTTELTLTNWGSTDTAITYFYTAAAGGADGTLKDTLPAMSQMTISDAIEFLRGKGIPVGETGTRLGTLRVEFSGLSAPDAAAVTVRTTTPVPEGRAGLSYSGLRPTELLSDPVFLCGLRQNGSDRSNVAVLNAGGPGAGEVVLRLTVISGDPGVPASQGLPDISLPPGGFRQVSSILSSNGLSLTNGFVKVERVAGTAPYYAYGVINDQVNSDGSFIEPVSARLEATSPADLKIWALSVPAVVETEAYSSELVLTNLTSRGREINGRFISPSLSSGAAYFNIALLPFEQQILPSFVQLLRDRGAIPDARGPAFVGPVEFRSSEELHGLSIGVRTVTPGGGGRYGVHFAAVSELLEAQTTAWLFGLQQDDLTRSNLAIVRTGHEQAQSTVATFRVDLFDGATMRKACALDGIEIQKNGFLQVGGILSKCGGTVSSGFAQITKTSGDGGFVTYAVVNDGGQPGQRSGDGAFVRAYVEARDPFTPRNVAFGDGDATVGAKEIGEPAAARSEGPSVHLESNTTNDPRILLPR